MEYIILEEFTKGDLQKKVESYLKDGWEVTGGVSVAISGGYSYYSQALVKH